MLFVNDVWCEYFAFLVQILCLNTSGKLFRSEKESKSYAWILVSWRFVNASTSIFQFDKAAQDVKNLNSKPTDAEMLEVYALFKQATVGDVNTSELVSILVHWPRL